MRYEVFWDPRVPQGLRSLPEAERKRVVGRILSLSDEPVPSEARRLSRPPSGAFRLDDGRFRLLYVVDARIRTVTIYAVLKDGELLNPDAYRIDA
jgi:mRNA-degrading endonuclease RelE of RelBE toxin-antitoxin system